MTFVLSHAAFREVVQTANLAPSVHNTQPTRWRLERGGTIELSIDGNRRLTVGDPEGRDARLSCGAALEGTRLALSEMGLEIKGMEMRSRSVEADSSLVLSMECRQGADVEPLAAVVARRFTWRKGFAKADEIRKGQLWDIASARDDVVAASTPGDIAALADMNDQASGEFFSNRPYREELVSWMRLSPRHPRWTLDGLNADAMGLTPLEAFGAGIVLRTPVFELLQSIRLAKLLISERPKTLSAAAIFLFHRPAEEDPLDSGMAFYRLLLALAKDGFSAWPMAVLADDPNWRAEISARFKIPANRRLINVLRVGPIPTGASPGRARIDPDALIL